MRRLNHLIETQIRYWMLHEEGQLHEVEAFWDAAHPALTREGEQVLVPVLKQRDPLEDIRVELPKAVRRF